jgi:predicted transcriptional regulator
MKAAEIARNMLKEGFTVEKTAELSGLDISKVRTLT